MISWFRSLLSNGVNLCAAYASGQQKKGKAGKQALGIFASNAKSERQRELLKAVVDDDVIRVMLANVKVAAAGLVKAKASMKADKKAAATAKKQGGGK